jgi:hypothetical protein
MDLSSYRSSRRLLLLPSLLSPPLLLHNVRHSNLCSLAVQFDQFASKISTVAATMMPHLQRASAALWSQTSASSALLKTASSQKLQPTTATIRTMATRKPKTQRSTTSSTLAQSVTRPSNLRRRNARVRPHLSQSSQTVELADGPYGLKRVDYSVQPPTWPLPPPPPTSAFKQNLPWMVAAGMIVFAVWVYNTRDASVYDYWRSVEQGQVPAIVEDDDDGDDEEEDEWPDDKPVVQGVNKK